MSILIFFTILQCTHVLLIIISYLYYSMDMKEAVNSTDVSFQVPLIEKPF